MTKNLLCILMFLSVTVSFSQKANFWQKSQVSSSRVKADKKTLPLNQTYSLNIEGLKQELESAPERGSNSKSSNIIVSFPNPDGVMERFRIIEASVMDAELQARYPEIRSYAGQGVDDPTAVIRFSISPLGFQSMRLSANHPASFIEPLTQDLTHYSIYKRSDVTVGFNDFECKVTDAMNKNINGMALRNADDGILRRYRLAMSVTGEYTQYYGGTKALALAAINATMTRVNGIFENDFNVTMALISNTDAVIYTNASSDPYSTNDSQWNSQLQSTLNSVIGNANYDIGHLLGASGNNGNAGCIGCVCVTNQKGSGYSTSTVPGGDAFDVDFVAHEIGHQFGANHTWTFNGNEGTGVQMEPGSGSTIMGYAGITGATYDVQSNSDPYFHAISIQQVTNYVKTTSCQTNINTGNAVPTANAGSNYTIPKGTPFVLTGAGSDANSGDVLTYCWEQIDQNNAVTKLPSTTATAGVAFRSYNPSTDNKRYFPNIATIKTGATSWKWEAVPNVARTLNFRLTVRDNKAGGANNKSDDTVITVNGTAGPFVVNAPNTNVTWNAGTTQTVTWSVAGTTGNGVNAANVDILLSTDGGNTYPITILANTPNDGSQAITVPNNPGSQNRIMVKGSNHIFFDISNTNFTIGGAVSCTATVPTGLSASNIGSSTATLSWNSVTGATYDLQYRVVGTSTWTTVAVTGTSTNLTGLSTSTQYEAQVRSKCSGGSNSAYSTSVNFTTTAVQLNYCASASTNTNDEYIGRVQLNTINNPSGAQFYSDFTSISTNLSKGTQYTITVTPTWTGTVYNEGYSVWIDYNRDGDFDDSGEQVWTRAATNTTPVSGSFTVPTGAATGATRMRVSMKYNAIPTACETFQYGEVEDYTVNIQGAAPDTTAPSTPTNLTASGTTQTTTNLSWTASTDNVAVTGYDVYQASTVIATVTGTTYQVTGLSPNTAYSFRVRAKDAAGNISGYSNTVNVITLSNSLTYCTSQGNNTNDEYIDRVQLGSINNLSGNNGGYANFTNLSTTLVKGTSNTITITPRWTGTVYNEAYRVWIDYNQDGDFNDSGEQVYNRTRTTATPISGSFAVPTSALNGTTRMRVSMKYNASPTSCETFTYGEVEDYTVIISSSARGEAAGIIFASVEFSVYPNPVKGSQLNLKVQGIEPNQVTIFNTFGQVVAKQVFSNTLDVSNLQGGIYVIEISDDNQKLTKRFIKQ